MKCTVYEDKLDDIIEAIVKPSGKSSKETLNKSNYSSLEKHAHEINPLWSSIATQTHLAMTRIASLLISPCKRWHTHQEIMYFYNSAVISYKLRNGI